MPYKYNYFFPTNNNNNAFAYLLRRIRGAIYQPLTDLDVTAYVTKEPVTFAQRQTGRKMKLKVGDKWGDLFDCAWFHITGKVPAAAAGRNLVLLVDLAGEGLVVDAKGNPLQGLTSSPQPQWYMPKQVVEAPGNRAGTTIDLWIDAGCNDLFGNLIEGGKLRQACIAELRPQLDALQWDVEVLNELMLNLPEQSARRQAIFHALCRADQLINAITEEEAAAARKVLAGELAKRGGDPSLSLSAVGHAHLDLVWLWPKRETIRKGARTFSTALMNLERYKDYVFGASQAQLYQWMKDYYPDLYRRVKKAAAAGRWEVQGGMWVEPDTNVSGGEALVRQLLYGKRFFRQEFGKDIDNLWLPDVFGYNAALPQILKKSGVDYFVTIKLSWNALNQFPHQTFFWEGIDGTSVIAHMPPEGTYNSNASPASIADAEKKYHDKGVAAEALLLFGIGDGGGGPGQEHLERLAREKNLAGLCPVTQEPAHKALHRLAKDAGKFVTWQGELYLELHQGTFTTQARNKRANRKTEIALRELELAAAQAMFDGGLAYPSQQIEDIWKETLLYQFHDCLPGSSIQRVYTESLARYAEMAGELSELTNKAEQALAAKIPTDELARPLVVRNSLSWNRTEMLKLAGKWRKVAVPSLGYTTIDLSSASDADFAAPKAAANRLENDVLRISFNADGSIGEIFDKQHNRSTMPAGASGNRLAMYNDIPGSWPAWDIQPDYQLRPVEYFKLVSSKAMVDGPRASIVQSYEFGSSRLTQEIVMMAGSRRVDFVTHVDWKETHRMLRTSFPVEAACDRATCEIQFGTIKRPMTTNTSWDLAKFEVPAQKFIDISDDGYGMALLNDCKYGHCVQGKVLDMTLLRSTTYPDRQADRCEHDFTYSILPHAGNHVQGRVKQAAYELNMPLRLVETNRHAGKLPASGSMLSVDCSSVVVEAVKKAEDDDAVIVRLYEADGLAARATLSFAGELESAELVNMIEDKSTRLRHSGRSVTLDFHPFEIHTLKVTFAGSRSGRKSRRGKVESL